jgi:hypothetical protein
MMFTLILTMQTRTGCCVHHIPGFLTMWGATEAGECWVKQECDPDVRNFEVVVMK